MRLRTKIAAAVSAIGLTALSGFAAAGEPALVATTEARTPEQELRAFRLPPGFVAELVAAEPEIGKPLNLAFDDRGRLWVTETVEYPFPVPEGETGRDGVKILSDFGPDGRARKVETFADGLNIPIGLLPLPSGPNGRAAALVHSIPRVLHLEDSDGDGRADVRRPLYETFGSKDTHGMTNAFSWGYDGWVYACHGFSNTSTVRGADDRAITMVSGNTYRMRPDGSRLEWFAHGQVNPFGLAFDPLGNLYSCDCHSRPLYQLLRGAFYPSFGKPDDGLGFGPEMATHDHGSTGIAGLVYYEADHFPPAYRGTTFIGNVVTNRINHDRIDWQGATPKAVERPDFLASDDPWFRPVDLELGPDGALYVADFYNRIIGHYEVPLDHPGRDRRRGRIWRVVYTGEDGKQPAPAMPPAEAFERPGHSNMAVRVLAMNRMVERNDRGSFGRLESLVEADHGAAAVDALWVLERLGRLSEARLAGAAADADRTVRVHAFRVLAERPTLAEPFAALTRRALGDADATVRKAAAEVLARHPDPVNLRPLLALDAATPPADTHLRHVALMALRDQLLEDRAWDALGDAGELSQADRDRLADAALGVPSAASAKFLLGEIKVRSLPTPRLARFARQVARHGGPGSDAELLASLRDRKPSPGLSDQAAALRAVQEGLQERGKALGDEAKAAAVGLTAALLDSPQAADVVAGAALAGAFRLPGVTGRLEALATSGQAAEAARAEALAALSAIDPAASSAACRRVLAEGSDPVNLRERASEILGATNRPEATAALAAVLPTAPGRLQSAVAAALARSRAGSEALLAAVAAGKASARLLQDQRVAGPLVNAGAPDLPHRLAALLKGLPPADKALAELIGVRRSGYAAAGADPAAGAKVFAAHCAACHRLDDVGGRVGPQLDGVGVRGLDRLLEDVLDPGRNVDQEFRLTTLGLEDGRVLSGLLLREEGEALVIADAQGKERRVARADVQERTVAPLSPMPADFAAQVPEADFYRLMAFLLSRRPVDTSAGGRGLK